MRIALLDDYQDVARSSADWSSLPAGTEVVAFHDHLEDEAALAERLRDFEVVVGVRGRLAFTRSLLERLPNLKLLMSGGGQSPQLDLAAANDLGVTVCTLRGVNSATAELSWALLLALARQIPQSDRDVREGRWQQTIGVSMERKTLGLVGLGNLGGLVAKVARAFGMNVIAWSRNLTPERAEEHGATAVTKDELFQRADFIDVHVPLTDESTGLVGARELALMKPTAYIVNTSRGPVVDERALAEALREHRIAGAGVDVFDIEPLPADHPFLALDNIIMTPHLGFVTRESHALFYRDAVENIAAFIAGSPVRVAQPRAGH